MDDVAAVAPSVPMPQVQHGSKQVHLTLACDDPASANKFRDYGKDDQRRKNRRHGGVEVRGILPGTHTKHDHRDADRDRSDEWEEKIALEAFERRLAPCE